MSGRESLKREVDDDEEPVEDEDDGPEPAPVQLTSDFTDAVKAYVDLQKKIADLRAANKDLKKALDQNKAFLMGYMERNKIERCNINGGTHRLILQDRAAKKKPDADEALQRLMAAVGGDERRASKLWDEMWAPVTVAKRDLKMAKVRGAAAKPAAAPAKEPKGKRAPMTPSERALKKRAKKAGLPAPK